MSNPANPDGQTQNSSLAGSNGEAHDIVGQLRDFLEIDDVSKQYARVLLALFTTHADDIVSEFYRKVQRSEISPHVTNDSIERLKAKQKAHWTALFNFDFSRDYAQSVRRAGIQHRDIALNPTWYVAGYAKLKFELMKRIAALDASSDKKMCLTMTLEQYVAIDMALALASYDSVILD